MVKIKIENVTIRFDETIKGSIQPKYLGNATEVKEVITNLSFGGGKYGNTINPTNCFGVDLACVIKNAYPEVKLPKIDWYDPPLPEGAIP